MTFGFKKTKPLPVPTFSTPDGQEWEANFKLTTGFKVRDELEINLLSMLDGDLYNVVADPAKTLDVLYVTCREQCEERGLTDEDFGRLFDFQSLADATNALVESILRLYPPEVQRTFRICWEAGQKLHGDMLSKMDALMSSGELEREINAAIGGE